MQAAQASKVVVFHRPDDPNKLRLARILKSEGKKSFLIMMTPTKMMVVLSSMSSWMRNDLKMD